MMSFYALLVGFLLGLTNVLMGVFSMELLSWAFIVFLEKFLVLKYLLIQSGFLFISIISLFFNSIFFVVAVLVKMGLPPFHLWFLALMSYTKKQGFLFMTTFHKIVPILLMSKVFFKKNFTYLIVGILILSGLMIMQTSSVFYVMLISSMVHSSWLILSSVLALSLMAIYWSVYSIILILFFSNVPFSFMSIFDSNQNSVNSLLWLVISGLPPFSMFWLKTSILIVLMAVSIILSVSALIVSVFSLSSYYRGYHLSLSLNKTINPKLLMFSFVVLTIGFL